MTNVEIGVLWYIITKQRQSAITSTTMSPVQSPVTPIGQVKYMMDKQTYFLHLSDPPYFSLAATKRRICNSRAFVLTVLGIL